MYIHISPTPSPNDFQTTVKPVKMQDVGCDFPCGRGNSAISDA